MDFGDGMCREPSVADLTMLIEQCHENRWISDSERQSAMTVLLAVVHLGNICSEVRNSVGDTLLATTAI